LTHSSENWDSERSVVVLGGKDDVIVIEVEISVVVAVVVRGKRKKKISRRDLHELQDNDPILPFSKI
jgi:hypothetical protein